MKLSYIGICTKTYLNLNSSKDTQPISIKSLNKTHHCVPSNLLIDMRIFWQIPARKAFSSTRDKGRN